MENMKMELAGLLQEKQSLIVVGIMNKLGYESDNRVYSRYGCSPSQRGTNNKVSYVIRKWI
jgi:hypothetical protein